MCNEVRSLKGGVETNISILTLFSFATSFRFPTDLLLTSSSGELWRMVRIGGQPLGFGELQLVCFLHDEITRGRKPEVNRLQMSVSIVVTPWAA